MIVIVFIVVVIVMIVMIVQQGHTALLAWLASRLGGELEQVILSFLLFLAFFVTFPPSLAWHWLSIISCVYRPLGMKTNKVWTPPTLPSR